MVRGLRAFSLFFFVLLVLFRLWGLMILEVLFFSEVSMCICVCVAFTCIGKFRSTLINLIILGGSVY